VKEIYAYTIFITNKYCRGSFEENMLSNKEFNEANKYVF
jgi:hypothetical protein